MNRISIKDSSQSKSDPRHLAYKVCLAEDPCPHYFKSKRQAYQWLLDHGKGHIKKRILVEFAFPLEKKLTEEVWVKVIPK